MRLCRSCLCQTILMQLIFCTKYQIFGQPTSRYAFIPLCFHLIFSRTLCFNLASMTYAQAFKKRSRDHLPFFYMFFWQKDRMPLWILIFFKTFKFKSNGPFPHLFGFFLESIFFLLAVFFIPLYIYTIIQMVHKLLFKRVTSHCPTKEKTFFFVGLMY